jgi:GT2 family glycosyltransferase
MARSALECNENGTAAGLFAAAVATDPGNPAHWYGLGSALLAGGWFDEAAEALNRATKLDPTDDVKRFDRDLARTLGSLLRGEKPAKNPFTELDSANAPVASHVTLVMPVFNTNPAHINQALRSVRAQTLRPARVVIVDDGSSSPATRAFLGLAAQAPHVELVTHKKNLTLGPAMNTGIAHAATPYVLKLDSDDIARPHLLRRLVEELKLREDADVIGCQMEFFWRSNIITSHPLVVTKRDVVGTPGYWFVNNTGVLLKRKSILSIGGYKALPSWAPEDYELWTRLFFAGKTRIRNVPEVLLDYRDHSASLHANFKRIWTRLFLIGCKARARLAPVF